MKEVRDYIRAADSTLNRIFDLMQDGSIKMSDAVWNELEDKVEGAHFNYHPEVQKFLDEENA